MGQIISLADAEEVVRRHAATVVGNETVPLDRCLGRRLATDHMAPVPWPTTDRSAMDGFAVAAGDGGLAAGTGLEVIGECLAGHPFTGEVGAGQAIRIMTGAVVPASVDAVVPVENTSGFGAAQVTLNDPVQRGAHIRRRGSEVAAGAQLLATGQCIRSAEIGVLAVLGIEQVAVYRRPVVAILSTGDEVVAIGREPAAHEVRDSNSYALAAQVEECGGEARRLGVGPDALPELRTRLESALADADVVLTIGGVSKGTHDLVHGCLRQLEVEEQFHGVALKPGKPTYFGVRRRGDKTVYVFGLPGNPASCYTVFDLLVRPLLSRIGGGTAAPQRVEARVGGATCRRNWRLQAVPARLALRGGEVVAELESTRPSGDPFGLTAADGYLLVPADADPGAVTTAAFQSYGDGLLGR